MAHSTGEQQTWKNPFLEVAYSKNYLIDPKVDSGIFIIKTFLWEVSNSIYILDNCILSEEEGIDSLVFIDRLMERSYFFRDSTANISKIEVNDRINLIMYEQLDKSYIQPEMVQFYHYIISLDDCLSLYISLKQHKGEDYHENFEGMVKNLVIERGACRRCIKGCYTTFHPLLEETVDCN
jgi:hypothetical protein